MAMEVSDSLESLQMLQRDLVAVLDSRLENVDRLSMELEAHITDFKRLLDQDRRNEKSRNSVTQGTDGPSTLAIGGLEYTISADFKDAVLTVANEVDLDELEAAKLCLLVQDEMDQIDDTLPYRAVLRFHTQRKTLLDCFRLILRLSLDASTEDEDEVGDIMQTLVRLIVKGDDSSTNKQSAYWRKCISCLSEIEESMSKTQSHIQMFHMTGQTVHSVRGEALQIQRMFLAQQHEALAAIMCYLIRTHNVLPEDFRAFLSKAAASELGPDLLSHFTPILIAGASRFGSDPATSQTAADDLHRVFADGPAQLAWKNQSFGAAAAMWWVVEYSGRNASSEASLDKSSNEHGDLDTIFFQALERRAFHYMLSVGDFYKPEVWHDPAKAGLVRFLLDNTSKFPREAVAPSPEFAQLTMQEMQIFTEALVSHMHGALRELKVEEDTRRRNLGFDASQEDVGYEMHLERFLLIIAFAYQDDLVAAMDFWGDTESNLYGFLRWTSRRLPTPRVAALCEMLRSLANGEKAATSAHRFLLEDTVVSTARARRSYSLSWQQMFSELELYASSIKNRPAVQPSALTPASAAQDPDIIEAETPIMLEAYLRLIAHVVRNSTPAREWVLHEQAFKLHECLLQLAQSAIPAAVQACCFEVLAALLTKSTSDIRDGLWLAVDNWLLGDEQSRAQTRSQHRETDRLYLQRIAADTEVAASFVNMLIALLSPVQGRSSISLDELPFPEQLGASRRHGGIDHYVDFVLAMAFSLSAAEPLGTEDRMQTYVLRYSCLAFVQICLDSFNEDLALLASSESTSATVKSFSSYARLHPFGRVMEQLLNDQVIAVLFHTVQQNPDELRTLPNSSPLVQAVCMATTTINLVLDKQATYFDIVRPIVKTQTSRREPTVSNPAFACFDDVILGHLSIIGYLAGYVSCPYDELVLLAIDLLKRLSASKKIAVQADPGAPHRTISRLVSRLADSGEALQIEMRQMFVLEDSSPLGKVHAVLDLLIASLSTNIAVPTLAHCLLGFTCGTTSLSIADGSLFSQGKALFHSIASLTILLPQDDNLDHPLVLQAVRRSCMEILNRLTSVSLTSSIVVAELQSLDFIAAVQASFVPVSKNATWDSFSAADPGIWLSDGSSAIGNFFRERENLFNLVANDRRLGSTAAAPPEQPGLILSLLDFFGLDIALPVEASPKTLTQFDASGYLVNQSDGTNLFDIRKVTQALAHERRNMIKGGSLQEQSSEQQIEDEISAILASLDSYNKYKSIIAVRLATLESWVDLASTMLADETTSADTLQNMLQEVMPAFDRALGMEMNAAAQFAKVILVLVRTVRDRSLLDKSLLLQDALLHAYRSSLRAIQDSETDLRLRDICYRICSSVLETLSRSQHAKAQQVSRLLQDVNDRVVRVVAEDAFANRGVTRISALLFLDAVLREFSVFKRSNALLQTFQKVNFIPVLIDSSISNMAAVFRDDAVDQATALAYFHTATTVLLRVAQAPNGAQTVLNSGFISAVDESGLFSTDPDIGLDIDNTTALREFYRLLAAILRIMVAIVIGRGVGDGATMLLVRKFLSDNRMSMAAVFKLSSKQDKTAPELTADAQDIADELGRLIHVTNFLEEDEQGRQTPSQHRMFT